VAQQRRVLVGLGIAGVLILSSVIDLQPRGHQAKQSLPRGRAGLSFLADVTVIPQFRLLEHGWIGGSETTPFMIYEGPEALFEAPEPLPNSNVIGVPAAYRPVALYGLQGRDPLGWGIFREWKGTSPSGSEPCTLILRHRLSADPGMALIQLIADCDPG
jgi:hypothetical protein